MEMITYKKHLLGDTAESQTKEHYAKNNPLTIRNERKKLASY